VRHQPQHGNERHRVAETDHRTRRQRRGQRFGGRQYQLARRHHRGPGEDQRLGAESVEQQAGRHLRAGIDDDLKDHECGQRTRAGAEAVRGIQTGHAEGGAVEDRDDVCEQSGGPDNPGMHTEPFAAEMGLRYCKRVATP